MPEHRSNQLTRPKQQMRVRQRPTRLPPLSRSQQQVQPVHWMHMPLYRDPRALGKACPQSSRWYHGRHNQPPERTCTARHNPRVRAFLGEGIPMSQPTAQLYPTRQKSSFPLRRPQRNRKDQPGWPGCRQRAIPRHLPRTLQVPLHPSPCCCCTPNRR